MRPSTSDSMLFHYPYVDLTRLQAEALGLDQLLIEEEREEEKTLLEALKKVRREYDAEGVVAGALLSDYQRLRFSMAAEEAGLRTYTPLWRIDQAEYMRGLVREGFVFILTTISAMGLPPRLLGRPLSLQDVEDVIRLAGKYGFNPAFEGGEAETLVLDAPLFSKRLSVSGHIERVAEDVWIYRITKAWLEEKG